jgi:hypothetical protein
METLLPPLIEDPDMSGEWVGGVGTIMRNHCLLSNLHSSLLFVVGSGNMQLQ